MFDVKDNQKGFCQRYPKKQAVLIEKLFIKNEIFILPISIGLIVVWFFMLSFIDKKIAKNDKYVCEIIEILNKC